jgi:integrase
MMPGVHRVRAPLARGRVAVFWYAWRGGPRILRLEGASDAIIDREAITALPAAIKAYQEARETPADDVFLYGLITRYLTFMQSDACAHMAERTKADRRKHLDKVREAHGQLELRALESRRARKALLDWRDSMAATPKTADDRLGALSVVLQWAVDRGDLAQNPIEEFPRIYQSNRAEVIWEPHHLETLLRHCASAEANAVRLAALTGLRMGDLIRLPWSAVGLNAIVWQTGKSRGRRTIVVPVTIELRRLLDTIPKGVAKKGAVSLTILNSSRGRPWTESGLNTAVQRAHQAAEELAVERHGPDAKSGIEHLRFHDLRGTAATHFIRAGLTLEEVATIVGWTKDQVEQIALKYVTAEVIGLAFAKRLDRAAKPKGKKP